MKVSIIIINYNTFQLTTECIRSVIEKTKGVDYEILLFDNASTNCNPADFLKSFPSITLIRSEINGGFAHGNNLGITVAKGKYILLLNSDTILTEDAVSLSVNYLDQHSDTGVLGCRMTFPSGKIQYTARRFRTIRWELLDLFRFLPFMMSYQKRASVMLGKYFRHDENMEADWVNGAFFMFPATLLTKFPGNKLDDRFFMYGEDQLWCWQIKQLGYKARFFAGTTIIHINSGSTAIGKQLNLRKTIRKHELEIIKERKGKGGYYYFFNFLYTSKEMVRNFVKWCWYKLSGKLIR
jgi:GT2 family glycosyltransferase